MSNDIDEYVKRKNELKTDHEKIARSITRFVKFGFVAWAALAISAIAFLIFCVAALVHFVLLHW
jgi:hypothetical protein